MAPLLMLGNVSEDILHYIFVIEVREHIEEQKGVACNLGVGTLLSRTIARFVLIQLLQQLPRCVDSALVWRSTSIGVSMEEVGSVPPQRLHKVIDCAITASNVRTGLVNGQG